MRAGHSALPSPGKSGPGQLRVRWRELRGFAPAGGYPPDTSKVHTQRCLHGARSSSLCITRHCPCIHTGVGEAKKARRTSPQSSPSALNGTPEANRLAADHAQQMHSTGHRKQTGWPLTMHVAGPRKQTGWPLSHQSKQLVARYCTAQRLRSPSPEVNVSQRACMRATASAERFPAPESTSLDRLTCSSTYAAPTSQATIAL